MTKVKILVIFFLFVHLSVCGQKSYNPNITADLDDINLALRLKKSRVSSNVDKESYLFENWSKANILLKGGKELSYNNANYDIRKDKIVLKDAKGGILVVYKGLVKSISFQNHELIYLSKVSSRNGFYELLLDGGNQFSLLKKWEIKKKKESLNPLLGIDGKNTVIEKTYTLFGYKGNLGELTRIPKRKKVFVNFFGEKYATLIFNYIQDNQLNYTSVNDLKSIFSYYNKFAENEKIK